MHQISKTNLSSIILVSSDSDLKPVVEKVQSVGMAVEYVGFENMYSIALLNAANKRILLTEKQLEEFLPTTLV